jgi:hypothetical protein
MALYPRIMETFSKNLLLLNFLQTLECIYTFHSCNALFVGMTVIRNGQELEREIVALYYTLSSVPLSDT